MDDRFNQVWARTGDYPNTILRPLRSHEYHERDSRCEKLKQEQDDLFDDSEQKMEFWETGRENQFSKYEFRVLGNMREHLERAKSDPQIRHTFLESDDSRSPLNCHPDILKMVFTYHQVDPSFLDAVHTFGDQEDPKDLSLMSFKANDTLTTPKHKLAAVPRLNRSGRDINIWYLLRAPECKKIAQWRWQIRQVAVYHSFDSETGKSFWFTIKGNDEFNRRIRESSPYLDLPSSASGPNTGSSKGPSTDTTASDYFAASLATHLVYLSWCDENWRQYINDIEDSIRHILQMVRKAPIDDDLEERASILETYPKPFRDTKTRNSTMRSNKHADITKASKTNTGLTAGQPGRLQKRTTLEVIQGAGNALMSYLNPGVNGKQKVGDPEKDPAAPSAPTGGILTDPRTSEDEGLFDNRAVLNKFRFSDVQTLYTFSDRIRRAILTLTLNISVLGEMHAYYSERLLNSDLETFHHIKAGCTSSSNGDSLGEFLREVQSLAKRLETRRAQLECLGALLTEGNALYDGILQYRQLDISQRFQETGQKSADQMQIIANKTRLETASMHVITVVTMIFLPATFVASILLVLLFPQRIKTFFQSGVFLWDDETWRYRGDGFSLFAIVSVPMMIVTVGAWLGVFLYMRRTMGLGLRRARAVTWA